MSYPTREQSIPSFQPDVTTGVMVRRPETDLRPRNGDGSGQDGAHSLARALGWFSIGLGLTEVLLPRKLGRAIGVGEEHATLLPLMGLREIAAGIGVLAAADPTTGVRARVAGDVLDLALLGTALASPDNERGRVAAATAAVIGVTALDVFCAAQLPAQSRSAQPTGKPGHSRTSLAINRPADQLYTYWRNLGNLPRVMQHLASVHDTGDRRSHWVAKGPAGVTVEWDAETTEETPNQRLAWRSLPGSDVPTDGYVEFKPMPAGRGTLVTLDIDYRATGPAAKLIAKLFGAALRTQLENDLRRWKQLMETGEVATTEGQPSGKRSLISRHLP
jgi:uncharacterized membrane protein